MAISHLAYADDLLIFLRGTQRNLRRFHTFLTTYENASGQKVNFHKSSFIPSSSVTSSQCRIFKDILGMRATTLPFRYLGSYLHKGITQPIYCSTLLQHVDDRLHGWHARLLSSAGRLVLLRSVIAALPLHILATGGFPKSVIRMIDRKMSAFYWGDRHHWVAWKKITTPVEEGGLGLRNLSDLQQAYQCRIWWTYQKQNTLWSQYMHMKYGRRGDYHPRLPDSAIWKLICRIHHTCISQTTGAGSFLSWTSTPTGEFTLKAAYDICRVSRPTQLSTKFIWFKQHSPSTRILLWRLFHSAMPFEDYIGRYLVARPTQCPFCRAHSATVDHVFIYCSRIRYLWGFFATELHGILPTSLSLHQYLLAWWYRSTPSLLFGVLKIVIPAIIVSDIWRHYAQLVYGDPTTFSTAGLRNSIHFDIHMWILQIQGSKLAAGPTLSLSPGSPVFVLRVSALFGGKLLLQVDSN